MAWRRYADAGARGLKMRIFRQEFGVGRSRERQP